MTSGGAWVRTQVAPPPVRVVLRSVPNIVLRIVRQRIALRPTIVHCTIVVLNSLTHSAPQIAALKPTKLCYMLRRACIMPIPSTSSHYVNTSIRVQSSSHHASGCSYYRDRSVSYECSHHASGCSYYRPTLGLLNNVNNNVNNACKILNS